MKKVTASQRKSIMETLNGPAEVIKALLLSDPDVVPAKCLKAL